MRDGFIFYKSFHEAASSLPDEIRLKVYDMIIEYALTGIEPVCSGIEKTIFILVKPQLDANKRRYENGKKGAEHGAKGGRPKTPKKPLNNPTETPKEKDKVKEKEKDKIKNNIIGLRPLYISENLWNDFLAIRKAKKAPLTQTALNGIQKEADKARISLEMALKECCSRGWQGFKAEWYLKENEKPPEINPDRKKLMDFGGDFTKYREYLKTIGEDYERLD